MGDASDLPHVVPENRHTPMTGLHLAQPAGGSSENRYVYLDGLRGVAAVGVVFSHLFQFLFPSLHSPGPDDSVNQWIASTPLSAFYNGQFSVYIFFVLSGFVLSASVSRSRLSLPSTLLRRYVRLTLPIVGITFLYLIAARSGLLFDGLLATHAPGAATIYPPDFSPSVGHWLTNTLFGVYWTGTSDLNGALWTMKVEIWGSLFVYLVWFAIKDQHLRVLFCVAAAIALSFLNKDSTLQGLQLFPVGILLFDLSVGGIGRGGRMAFLRWPFWVGLLVLLLGLSLGAWRLKNPVLPGAHILADLLLDPIFGHVSRYEAHQIGGILVVSAVVFTSRLQAPLSNGVSKFLGAVSFPLYLSHVLVLASFGCLLLAWSDTAFGVSVARVIAISATFIVSVLVAALLRRLVEEPSIAFARQIGGGCDRWLRKRIKFA